MNCMWVSKKNEQGSSLYLRYNLYMRRTVKLSLKKENLVTEFQLIKFHGHRTRIGSTGYRIPADFDFLCYSSKVDLVKVD